MYDPLTGGTRGAGHMAAQLLTYANRQKVAEALTERGYAVTRMTVNRWARGSEMPEIAARMILDLFGHTPETRRQPPPEWARAMQATLDSVHARQDTIMATTSAIADEATRNLIEVLAPAELRAAARLLNERLAALPLPDVGAPNGSDEGEDRGGAAPPGHTPGSHHGLAAEQD